MPTDALKIKTTVPQGVVIAGRPFSITTTVTNPYEDQIEIMYYTFYIPYQVQWIADVTFDQKFRERSSYSSLRQWLGGSIWDSAASPPGQVMSTGNLTGEGKGMQIVGPGEAQNYTFKAMMPQWLFITGGQLSFQGLIAYRRGTNLHTSTFEISFPYRPPLRAISMGALVGALLGSAAKILKDSGPALLHDKAGAVTSTLLAVILSTIAVVYSSRRSNETQPVLTVEDVWGGMILGFLIGYLGNEFFQTIVPVKSG